MDRIMLVAALQKHLSLAQKSLDRAVQCADNHGAHQEAAYEFGRVEEYAAAVESLSRLLIGVTNLEK